MVHLANILRKVLHNCLKMDSDQMQTMVLVLLSPLPCLQVQIRMMLCYYQVSNYGNSFVKQCDVPEPLPWQLL